MNPDGRPGLSIGADRELVLVRSGWQLVVVAAGTALLDPIPTWVNPDGRPGLSIGADRELVLVRSGWQLVVVAAGTALLVVRVAQARRSGESDADRDRREVA